MKEQKQKKGPHQQEEPTNRKTNMRSNSYVHTQLIPHRTQCKHSKTRKLCMDNGLKYSVTLEQQTRIKRHCISFTF